MSSNTQYPTLSTCYQALQDKHDPANFLVLGAQMIDVGSNIGTSSFSHPIWETNIVLTLGLASMVYGTALDITSTRKSQMIHISSKQRARSIGLPTSHKGVVQRQ